MDQIHVLNHFIEESMTDFGLNETTSMNIKLALEEAVVNIISYAYPGEKNKKIHIRLEYDNNRLTIVVTDTGVPFDPTEMKEPDISSPLEERPIGGLGTYLVKQLMTEVCYQRTDNKNILTLIKEIH
ncbi:MULTISPECIES: ATP-binding protein [unclassified Parabacteroides]|uniref:ATP-binding protein n=1 Tax=unclassified Parabacteroides TaxID=2649774 RepID=UPI002475F327|nr:MULTISPECIES: ATP-binding protein [unclassified Parabacteroides]